MREFQSIKISTEAEAGAARRVICGFAATLGCSVIELAELEIAVQEIATNAARYATDGGTIYYAPFSLNSSSALPRTFARNADKTETHAAGIEIVYLDKGPGIYNLERAVSDGVSSGGSLGSGFGAIRRMTDFFNVYSTTAAENSLSAGSSYASYSSASSRRSTHGTAILCRKLTLTPSRLTRRAPNYQEAQTQHAADDDAASPGCGAWSRLFPGETRNGDAYFSKTLDDTTLAAVVDGLGHGSGAHEAACVAVARLDAWSGEPLDELIFDSHNLLRATRGAVMSALTIDRARHRFQFAGVGNIQTRVFNSAEPIHLIPANGTLGARLARVPVWAHDWTPGATAIMTSDGISTSWDIAAYPKLLDHDAQLVAAVIMRDHHRTTDDATVMVVR